MVGSYNVNDNVKRDLINNDNVNDIDIDKSKRVEQIAHKLVDKFGSPGSFQFYCKVAYELPEHKIWNNYEMSLKGRTPGKLFNWLCQRDMK